MKEFTRSLINNPRYATIYGWGKLISITGSAQIFIQAIGLINGFVIIRLLPTEEYALYTLANTMLGTLTVLADGGISTGVMAQGGRAYQDNQKLGEILSTGLYLRRKFALYSSIVAIPFLVYILYINKASYISIILIVFSIIPAFYAALSDSLLEIIPKLKLDINPLQKNQVLVSVYRLLLSGFTLMFFPWAYIAIMAAGIPRMYGNFLLKKVTYSYVPLAPINKNIQIEIIALVKRTMPGLIYYCVSGQITIWILSIFGKTTSVAQIGAMGRIAILMSILSVVFSTILIPRFARLSEGNGNLSKKILQIIFLFGGICAVVMGFLYIFSTQILWILGPKFSNLETELVFYILGTSLFTLTGFIYSLVSSRGLILNPTIYISFSILAMILGAIIFDVKTLNGILNYNIFVSIVQLGMYVIFLYKKILNRWI